MQVGVTTILNNTNEFSITEITTKILLVTVSYITRHSEERERGIHRHGNMSFILCSFEFITKPASVTAGGSVVLLALLAEGILEEIMAGFKS